MTDTGTTGAGTTGTGTTGTGTTDAETRRQRMANLLAPRHAGGVKINIGYSRFVDLMRWILPVTALVLVAILIAWPGRDGADEGLTLSFVDLGGHDEKLRMISPRYVGTDSHGQPFVITADAATQDETDQDIVTLDAVEADVTLDDGRWIVLQSPTGIYNRREQTLAFGERVDIYSDDGHQFNAEDVRLDLANGIASSAMPVHGQGPMGIIDAKGFKVLDGGKITRFEGGVRLVIRPRGTD